MRDDHFKALVKDAEAVVNGDEGKRAGLDAKAAAMEEAFSNVLERQKMLKARAAVGVFAPPRAY